MWIGTRFALAAGLMWGLVFIAPTLLPDDPAVQLSCARYLARDLIALPLAWNTMARELEEPWSRASRRVFMAMPRR